MTTPPLPHHDGAVPLAPIGDSGAAPSPVVTVLLVAAAQAVPCRPSLRMVDELQRAFGPAVRIETLDPLADPRRVRFLAVDLVPTWLIHREHPGAEHAPSIAADSPPTLSDDGRWCQDAVVLRGAQPKHRVREAITSALRPV